LSDLETRSFADPQNKVVVFVRVGAAWRKVATNLEIGEAVTDIDAVIELHNRCFSPVWGRLSGDSEKFRMGDLPF
jgi:hypothetical protein